MSTAIDNWYVIVALVVLVVILGIGAIGFFRQPSATQLRKVKAWLLFAVTNAEAKLGSETGQVKLRYVYDLFITRFKWLSVIISFDLFADLVDEALVEMRLMLQNNPAVRQLVKSGGGIDVL